MHTDKKGYKMQKQIQAAQMPALPENCVMTLKDVVDTINNARGVKSKDKGFIEHGKAKKVIEEMSKDSSFGRVDIFSTRYVSGNNAERELETLALTKKQAIAAAARLDNAMLMKVIDRVEELEAERKQGTPSLPQTYVEALKELVKAEEAKQLALSQAKEQKQIATEQTVIANKRGQTIKNVIHSANTYTASQVAKDMKHPISAKLMNRILSSAEVIFKQGDTWQLYSRYAGYGLTSIKETEPDSDGKTFKSLRWTALGKSWIYKHWEEALERASDDLVAEWESKITEGLPSIPGKRAKKEKKKNG